MKSAEIPFLPPFLSPSPSIFPPPSLTPSLRYILEGARDLQQLVSLSEVQQLQLEELLGNSTNAPLLFSFLHSPAQQTPNNK